MARVTITFNDESPGTKYEGSSVTVGFRMALRGVMAGYSVRISHSGAGVSQRRRSENRARFITLDEFAGLLPREQLVALRTSLLNSEHVIPACWISEYLRHAERRDSE